jgi:FixJ family two-component response regulator
MFQLVPLRAGGERPPSGPSRGRARRPAKKSATLPVVYILDDDDAVRSALRMLVRVLGWEARDFGRGAELLDDALPEGNACLLVDLNMPEINGAEVVERLRAKGSRLPVIGFTGERDSPLIPRMLAAGARTVLFKPIHDEALRAAVAGALKAAP